MNILNTLISVIGKSPITTTTIVITLIITTALSAYEFIVYRFVSKKGIYNNDLNIAIVIVPYFIATIILCLQSNMVITLGTIGALAIIRFRTAVKDPTDIVYLLWSIHNGIMVGCQLYEVAILTSVVVTIIVGVFSRGLSLFPNRCYVLAINFKKGEETVLSEILAKEIVSKYEIVSRNYSDNEINYIIEVKVKNLSELENALKENKAVNKFSVFNSNSSSCL